MENKRINNGYTMVIFLLGVSLASLVCGSILAYKALRPLGPINNLQIQNSPAEHVMPAPKAATNGALKRDAIVRLHQNGHFFCSGIVIAANYVLTAAHCVADASGTIEILTLQGESVTTSEHWSADERSDLAVIECDCSAFNAMEVDSTAATVLSNIPTKTVSSPILACGYPHGGGIFCSELTDLSPQYFSLHAHGYLYPGMSGGPVINMRTNRVFAVNTAVAEQGVLVSPLIELWTDLHIACK